MTGPRKDQEEEPTPDASQLLRALAHPLRIQLAQAMSSGTARNVSDLAETVGEAANSVSFHIRQLAKYGLVEKVDGPPGTSRRESWWQLVPQSRRIDLDLDGAAGAERTARVAQLRPLLTKQALDRLEGLLAAVEEPGGHGTHNEYAIELTDEEAEALLEQLAALAEKRRRAARGREDGGASRRWRFLIEGYPEVRPGR